MSTNTAADVAEALEIRFGRRAPWSQIGDWISLAPIDAPAVRLYNLLAGHVNQDRREQGDTEVWPTLHMLAVMMGYSRRDKITKFVDQLVGIGAIDVRQVPVPGGGNRTRSIYTVHQTPPPGYTGLVSLGEFYAGQKRDQKAKEATGPAATTKAETGESRYPERGTGPVPQMGYGTGTSNGVRNKKKKPTTNNENGGASRRPPEPPADKTPGHVDLVPTDQRNPQGDQPTARVERGVSGDNAETNSESNAVVGIPAAAVVGGDGAHLEVPSARDAALAAAAAAKTRGTVRSRARKTVQIRHQKPVSAVPSTFPTPVGENGSESPSGAGKCMEPGGGVLASNGIDTCDELTPKGQ